MLLFFDKETSGLPDFSQPSEAPTQPHIVQMAAALVDPDSRKIVAAIDLIIRPDGWEIPEEVAKIHGIDTAFADRVGVGEELALNLFYDLWLQSTLRVAHNQSFDARIVRIALKRYGHSEEVCELWKNAPAECTMEMAKPICQLPPTARMRGGFKPPKLTEAYEYFIGQPMEGAHNAMADVRGCMAVYWAIKDREVKQAMAHA